MRDAGVDGMEFRIESVLSANDGHPLGVAMHLDGQRFRLGIENAVRTVEFEASADSVIAEPWILQQHDAPAIKRGILSQPQSLIRATLAQLLPARVRDAPSADSDA